MKKMLITLVAGILTAGILVSCKDDCEKTLTGSLELITGPDVCDITYNILLNGEQIGTIGRDDTFKTEGIPFGPQSLVLKFEDVEFLSTSVQIYTCNTTTYSYNDICGPSDRRYKKNISPLLFNMNDFMQINAYTYAYRTDEFPGLPEGTHNGFMAQEMLGLYPQLVRENSDGYYAVNYSEMIPVLTRALQAQQRQIEVLQMEIAALKDKPEDL